MGTSVSVCEAGTVMSVNWRSMNAPLVRVTTELPAL